MAGSSFGTIFKVTTFGESHGIGLGAIVDGCPAGLPINEEIIQQYLNLRKPGQTKYSTPRKEADAPEFISGLVRGRTCGAPVTAIIRNNDTRSSDYEYMKYTPRPGHADYTAMVKYGYERDYSGGGQFSGRLTAPLCIAGGIAIQLLEKLGVSIAARIEAIGGERDEEKMYQLIDKVRAEGDSVGGLISCTVSGLPAGLGEPMFGGMENRIAQAVFGIPAVKGIEFGAGFAAAQMRGSQCNDPFRLEEGKVITEGNNHGGILGGISSGMPIEFRVAIKPTPSIAKAQKTVDMSRGEESEVQVRGRHDPCIVPRALPCVEAAAALAVYDAFLENRMLQQEC